MAFILVVLLCVFGLLMMCAGAAEIERRGETWARYERWMHPPDDDDGVSVLEGKDNADN